MQSCDKKGAIEVAEVDTDALVFNSNTDKTNGTIIFRLHRKSRQCFSGIGICHLDPHHPAEKSGNTKSRNNVVVPVTIGSKFVIFSFAEDVSNFNQEDLKFFVDEELSLTIDEKTLTVEKGIYEYDSQIGDFGGYKVKITFK